jgi:transposase InsO family protein
MEENLCLRSLTHAFLAECGIQRQTSAPYSPQQNGVVECANRFIMECAKNMTLHKGWNLNFGAKR